MTIKTKKKICAWISGGFAYAFLDMLWVLPDIRLNEGLDWRIEIVLYILTLVPAIVFGWLASGD
ncbi:MAG: hypothetical protein J5965_10095 [Aeriscardovia sp.]|nr:hypothetical protein [Aeriscardovia sp.]